MITFNTDHARDFMTSIERYCHLHETAHGRQALGLLVAACDRIEYLEACVADLERDLAGATAERRCDHDEYLRNPL